MVKSKPAAQANGADKNQQTTKKKKKPRRDRNGQGEKPRPGRPTSVKAGEMATLEVDVGELDDDKLFMIETKPKKLSKEAKKWRKKPNEGGGDLNGRKRDVNGLPVGGGHEPEVVQAVDRAEDVGGDVRATAKEEEQDEASDSGSSSDGGVASMLLGNHNRPQPPSKPPSRPCSRPTSRSSSPASSSAAAPAPLQTDWAVKLHTLDALPTSLSNPPSDAGDDRPGRNVPRYFVEEVEEGPEGVDVKNGRQLKPCGTCGETGHRTQDCTHTYCLTCGAFDEHKTRDCPVSLVCYACGSRGHKSSACPNARSGSRVCNRCNSTIHMSENCPSIWRQYEPSLSQPRREPSITYACYNCASVGDHFGDQCPFPRNTRGRGPGGGSRRLPEPSAFTSRPPRQLGDSHLPPRSSLPPLPSPRGTDRYGYRDQQRRGDLYREPERGRGRYDDYYDREEDEDDWFARRPEDRKRPRLDVREGPSSRLGPNRLLDRMQPYVDSPPPPPLPSGPPPPLPPPPPSGRGSLASRMRDPAPPLHRASREMVRYGSQSPPPPLPPIPLSDRISRPPPRLARRPRSRSRSPPSRSLTQREATERRPRERERDNRFEDIRAGGVDGSWNSWAEPPPTHRGAGGARMPGGGRGRGAGARGRGAALLPCEGRQDSRGPRYQGGYY